MNDAQDHIPANRFPKLRELSMWPRLTVIILWLQAMAACDAAYKFERLCSQYLPTHGERYDAYAEIEAGWELSSVKRWLRRPGDKDLVRVFPATPSPGEIVAVLAALEPIWRFWNAIGKPKERRQNPTWQRDELILALDLYIRLDKRIPDEKEPDVIVVGVLLNRLPIHPVRPDIARFRSPNGVVLKLATFRAIEQPGKGMSRGGRLDREVWDEFSADYARLRHIAAAIGGGYATTEG